MLIKIQLKWPLRPSGKQACTRISRLVNHTAANVLVPKPWGGKMEMIVVVGGRT
jgi:hypothetical protein